MKGFNFSILLLKGSPYQTFFKTECAQCDIRIPFRFTDEVSLVSKSTVAMVGYNSPLHGGRCACKTWNSANMLLYQCVFYHQWWL